jgi:two-component system LytT family response regulator
MSETDVQLKLKRDKFEKLCIPTMDGFNLIELDSIAYMQADNAYTCIYLDNNQKIISTRNLGYYEKIVSEKPFLRIHNSFIVNMKKVVKYIKGDEGYVVLENKKIIKVARSRKEELFRFFNIAAL